MNSFIVLPEEISDDGTARLCGARAERGVSLHDLKVGLHIRAAILNGLRGTAEVLKVSKEELVFKLNCTEPSPEQLPISLVVGLCRPQTVKKVIQAAVCFGVKELHFVRCERSQKSYLDADVLTDKSIKEQQVLALEQSCASQTVAIAVHPRFRPFIEDELQANFGDAQGFIAVTPEVGGSQQSDAPYGIPPFEVLGVGWLGIGGESGFNEFEVNAFIETGFVPIQLGQRVLRVEHALVAAISSLKQAYINQLR